MQALIGLLNAILKLPSPATDENELKNLDIAELNRFCAKLQQHLRSRDS